MCWGLFSSGPSSLFSTHALLFASSSHPSAAAALLAQLKFDSVILEVITVASAVAFVGRVTLSYKRLNDRWVVVPSRCWFVLGEGGCVLDGVPIPPPEGTPEAIETRSPLLGVEAFM